MKKKAKSATKKVQPIPANYGAVIPHLSVRGAGEAEMEKRLQELMAPD